MKLLNSPLQGLIILQPKVLNDNRGYFYEAFQQQRYSKLGMPVFVQDNVSRSHYGVLRGLHYQQPSAQGKLVGVTHGKVWDVVVDLRQQSPTFKKWFAITLSDENHTQMYIPPGFAHGFCVLSPIADFYYKCTDFYNSTTEHGILWNDKELNIGWPIKDPILSDKDLKLPTLAEIPHDQLFA